MLLPTRVESTFGCPPQKSDKKATRVSLKRKTLIGGVVQQVMFGNAANLQTSGHSGRKSEGKLRLTSLHNDTQSTRNAGDQLLCPPLTPVQQRVSPDDYTRVRTHTHTRLENTQNSRPSVQQGPADDIRKYLEDLGNRVYRA